jgi:hypothetical protein
MDSNGSGALVLLNPSGGVTLISDESPLTRLNYFDGKFLRAEDLKAEQDYLRRLVQMSNQAHGAGVVHGFEVTRLSGDRLRLSPGLAIDNEGRTLFLADSAELAIAGLLARPASASAPAGAGEAAFGECEPASVDDRAAPVAGTSLYLLGISLAEALCGHEDILGQLCQQVCVTESERPYRVEGVVLQARPLTLTSPFPSSTAVVLDTIHLRSRVASAYFADERRQPGSLISGAGLASSVWCAGAAASAGGFVPLGVLARSGQSVRFLDLWIARRERGAPHPVRYWQNRLAMRPWDVFMAQVLQFQCQLRDSWDQGVEAEDPCAEERRLIAEASEVMGELETFYKATSGRLAREALAAGAERPAGGASRLGSLLTRLQKAKSGFTLTPTARVLISRGIVELPSGGYLPVVPGANLTVNEQVRRLMGEGVDLRFCVVRPDYVAHALESVQHMDRISLLKGLDDPNAKEEVDILVPDGEIGQDAKARAVAWEGRVRLAPPAKAEYVMALRGYQRSVLGGAARSEAAPGGELSFFFAGLAELPDQKAAIDTIKRWAESSEAPAEATLWRAMNRVEAPEAAESAEAEAAPKTARSKKAAEAPETAIGAGYARLRQEALRYRAEVTARAAQKAGMRGQRQFAGLEDEPIDHAAVWVGARMDRDPFTVAEQTRIPASLDLTYLEPRSGGSLFVDMALTGRLTVEGRRTSGEREVLQGAFVGNAVVRIQFSSISSARRVVPINAPVVLSRRLASTGAEYVLALDLQTAGGDARGLLGVLDLEARLTASPDGREAQMSLTLRAEDTRHEAAREPVVFAAMLRRDDTAIKPGSALRAASETAIEVLATQEGGSGFAADAHNDLFGRPEVTGEPLVVRATRDWVMFHRRRDRRCSGDAALPETGVRRYQLYHLRVRTEAQARSARAAVLSADAARIAKLGFKPIAAVEFGIGRSALATPNADVVADWKAADPGPRIVFGAIGSVGPAQAEGEGLARARLSTLELTVSEDQATPQADNQVLPVLPDLGLGGMDGALFLVTQEAKTTCHTVYHTTHDVFPTLAQRAGLRKALLQLEMSPDAEAVFQDGSATPTAESAEAVKKALSNVGKAILAYTYYPGPDNDAQRKLMRDQGGSISEIPGGDPARVMVSVSSEVPELTQCTAITVLLVQGVG